MEAEHGAGPLLLPRLSQRRAGWFHRQYGVCSGRPGAMAFGAIRGRSRRYVGEHQPLNGARRRREVRGKDSYSNWRMIIRMRALVTALLFSSAAMAQAALPGT